MSLAFSSLSVSAQNFQTMPVASGFNADVIANGVGSSAASTNDDVDGVSYAFVAQGFQLTSSTVPLATGLPANGVINSIVSGTPGLSYQLGNLSSNNALRIATNESGTLVFSTPKAAVKLYMLSTTGSAGTVSNNYNITVTFTDNSTQVFTGITISDWFGGANAAIQGINRIKRSDDSIETPTDNPRLYQNELAISAANQTKLIQSVSIAKTSGPGIGNVFAFSADAFSDCAAPALQPIGTLTSNSAQISWSVPSTTTASSYNIYYSTTNTAPTSTTNPTISGFVGTTTTLNSLSSNTTYYYWVKTNCANTTGQSVWSFSGTFKTACGPMTSLSENFDSYATGTTLPDCWVRNFVNGTMSISSTTPASGTRNIYQTNTATQTPSTVVLPEFSNINAGTHWLRLKARVTAATGTLNVGYVTNPTDASTFVLIQALSISNTNYTSTNPEYTVIVPSTIPANARLAIRNTADSKGYYWDDVNWETIPTCLQPTFVVISNIALDAATITWTAPTPAPAGGYEYYYSTSGTAPVSTTTQSGGVGAGVTSTTLQNLTPNTMYYIWVRSVCSLSDKSTWSYVASFKTLCGPVPSLFENFDSYGTGDVVPDCWNRLAGAGGLQTLSSTTPASGTRNVYQYTAVANSPVLVVLPSFTNINSGTHQLRFKARVTAAPGTLNVGYLTNPTDISTFVLIQALSITNTSYTATNAEYTVTIPTSVPANARLAIHCSNDAKAYYWDDLYWENSNLGTAEAYAKKKLTIHPNPFKDVIYISETKDIKSVTVYDVAGRIVKLVNDASKEIHVGDLKEGMYLVKVSFNDGTQSVTKAIKK